jgi:hypothetical protein
MRISDLHRRILAGRIPINLLPNLVAYWNFDGNGTDSVNGITPILETGITYNNDSILGTSASYPINTGRIIRYADSNNFSFVNDSNTGDVPFSISFWLFFTAFSNTGNWIINKRTATSGGDEYQINYSLTTTRISLTKFQFNNNTISQSVRTSQNIFSLNAWYHIVVTDKGTANVNDINIYVNGLNDSDDRTTGAYTRMNNGTSSLGMMNSNWSPGSTFEHKGRLDEVAIWKNRELTPAEVAYLYNSGLGRTYPL